MEGTGNQPALAITPAGSLETLSAYLLPIARLVLAREVPSFCGIRQSVGTETRRGLYADQRGVGWGLESCRPPKKSERIGRFARQLEYPCYCQGFWPGTACNPGSVLSRSGADVPCTVQNNEVRIVQDAWWVSDSDRAERGGAQTNQPVCSLLERAWRGWQRRCWRQ